MTMQPLAGYVEVRTTLPTKEKAESLGEALVSARLAACVHITGPIHSIYHWENQIQHDTEWTCAVKTRAALYPDVERAILALHPYQTPQIIVVDITGGYSSYLDWLSRETNGS